MATHYRKCRFCGARRMLAGVIDGMTHRTCFTCFMTEQRKPELSLEMQRCLDFAKEHSGRLHRFPGGYWAQESWGRIGGRHFGTATVQALVDRGVLVYVHWAKGRGGQFPICATVVREVVS